MEIFKKEILNEISRKQSFLSKTYVAWLQLYNYKQHDFLRWSDLHVLFMAEDRKTSYGHKVSVQQDFLRSTKRKYMVHVTCSEWMDSHEFNISSEKYKKLVAP